jgi:hypothetical protein
MFPSEVALLDNTFLPIPGGNYIFPYLQGIYNDKF